jgi:hypothetical protein
MTARLTAVSLLIAFSLTVSVLELVRRHRLQERYAILWFVTMAVVLLLAVWPSALDRIASTLGIAYPPSALFVLASGFFILMLLHFSIVLSRLSHANVILAQEYALLEHRIRELEGTTVSELE